MIKMSYFTLNLTDGQSLSACMTTGWCTAGPATDCLGMYKADEFSRLDRARDRHRHRH